MICTAVTPAPVLCSAHTSAVRISTPIQHRKAAVAGGILFAGIDIASERHMLARLDGQGAPIGKPMPITEDRVG
ncbi:MAG: hypothetical protein ACP5NP_13205, partial [Acetobacteraceae bacterium]